MVAPPANPPDARLIYITTKDKAEAERIGRALLEERLVACINIIDPMSSLYWWDGKIESASESLLIAKTRVALVERVIAAVKERHSYECPCVVSLPIQTGNPDFLAWIARETTHKN
jgi:periplasmic divalent cation tolerance protein